MEESLLELLRIYSPTGKEEKAIEWFSSLLEENGLEDVNRDRVGNASGILKGSGLNVALIGHIDTVPGRLPVKINGDEITGRGAVDAKSSLISLFYGGMLARNMGFRGTIKVAAVVGEEGNGRGIAELAASHEAADYAVLGEPSGTTSVTVGYRGRILMDAHFKSEQFHASAPWMGQSALESAIATWSSIKAVYGGSSEFSKVSVALTSLRGGHSDNVTPSGAKMTLDIRFPPSIKREDISHNLREIIKGNGDSRDINLIERSYTEPYVSNLKTPLVIAFKDAIREYTGRDARMVFKSGSGDMNHLARKWGIPCITYGPGNTQLSHTNFERISFTEVKRSSEIVAAALLKLESGRITGIR